MMMMVMMRQGIVQGERAADAPTVTGSPRTAHPHSAITVLDSALRIVRVDLSQLDLGQDDARQPREELFDVLAGERGDFDRNGDI